MKHLFLSILLGGFFFMSYAQTPARISGVVLEAETLKGMQGVTIQIAGTNYESSTDFQGKFTLNDLKPDTYILIVRYPSYLGMEEQIVLKEGEHRKLNLQLELDPLDRLQQSVTEQLAVITITEVELDNDNDAQDISGLLSSSRDVFLSTAAFTFGPARFRVRGYDSDYTDILMNGMPVNDMETGRVYWSTWGGLNDATRNQEIQDGLSPTSYTFGGVGGGTNIVTRAARQRKQLKGSYALTNRSYRNRIMFTASTGLMKNGWAFTASGSRRWANEGYVPGTFYDAWAYFLSAEKQLNKQHSIELTAFGAPIRRGKSSGATQEMYDLAGTNYYNSYWGYQNGKMRNARVSNTHQPMLIFSHYWTPNEKTELHTAFSYQFGRNGTTALDWYDTRDPRPDYYRKLPSFAQDSEVRQRLVDWFREDEANRQLNWDYFFDINRNSNFTVENANGVAGNTIAGNRSRYVVEERRYDSKQLGFNTVLRKELTDELTLNSGLNYQHYQGERFKVLEDLLGGDYYLDIDKFAERDFIGNEDAVQNDLQTPNRVITEGDRFGYDYDVNIRRAKGWVQGRYELRRLNLFAAANFSQTEYWRTGNMQNGKFPDQSLGDSEKLSFTNWGAKGGVTYKLSGRHFVFANGTYQTRAPYFRNAFLSPRTRNQAVANLTDEKILSVEGGYLLRTPLIKARATAYYTQFQDQTTLRSFYHDELRSFVNYILSGVDKTHRGVELGVEAKIIPTLSLVGVAAMGEYKYTSRPSATIAQDNNSTLLAEDRTIYAKNFFVGGTPQTALSAGLKYNSPKYWFANINVNYFDHIYIDFNPDRRTIGAVEDLEPGTQSWESVISQEKAPSAVTVDFFGGKSWKFGKTFLFLNVGINNLLDKQDFKTGGYEQLRFDYQNKDVNRFPSRYFYYYGRNYFINLSVRR